MSIKNAIPYLRNADIKVPYHTSEMLTSKCHAIHMKCRCQNAIPYLWKSNIKMLYHTYERPMSKCHTIPRKCRQQNASLSFYSPPMAALHMNKLPPCSEFILLTMYVQYTIIVHAHYMSPWQIWGCLFWSCRPEPTWLDWKFERYFVEKVRLSKLAKSVNFLEVYVNFAALLPK